MNGNCKRLNDFSSYVSHDRSRKYTPSSEMNIDSVIIDTLLILARNILYCIPLHVFLFVLKP